MKVNNTNNDYTIKKKKNIQKKYLAGGIIISSLFISLATTNLSRNIVNNNDNIKTERELGEEKYNYYSKKYLEALKELNNKEYDDKFLDIYSNGKYIINGKEYNTKEIYIVQAGDNSIHLLGPESNDIDILTGKTFDQKRKTIMCFREASIFYEMYKAGIINDTTINIDNNTLKQYISNWDGKEHYETQELEAEKKAHDAYTKKYGR